MCALQNILCDKSIKKVIMPCHQALLEGLNTVHAENVDQLHLSTLLRPEALLARFSP